MYENMKSKSRLTLGALICICLLGTKVTYGLPVTGFWKCTLFGSIYDGWICDGVVDCPDGSDEVDCNKECDEDEFACVDDGVVVECLNPELVCDGFVDCVNAEDEENCELCPPAEIRCNGTNVGNIQTCIGLGWICDGEIDCPDGEDEVNCPTESSTTTLLPTTPSTTTATPSTVDCDEGYFQCKISNKCISEVLKCDGNDDCSDSGPPVDDDSDELNCPEVIECSSDEFACVEDGVVVECLEPEWVCDGWDDCDKGEDEEDCELCPPGKPTRCNGTDADNLYECIEVEWICDGEEDCWDGEDEVDCPTIRKLDFTPETSGTELPVLYTSTKDTVEDTSPEEILSSILDDNHAKKVVSNRPEARYTSSLATLETESEIRLSMQQLTQRIKWLCQWLKLFEDSEKPTEDTLGDIL